MDLLATASRRSESRLLSNLHSSAASKDESCSKKAVMKKLVFRISVLIALGLSALAQDSPSQSAKGSSTNQTTVQGCLNGSAGGFTLTDNSGTAYQLAGDTAKLTDHVGHQVE